MHVQLKLYVDTLWIFFSDIGFRNAALDKTIDWTSFLYSKAHKVLHHSSFHKYINPAIQIFLKQFIFRQQYNIRNKIHFRSTSSVLFTHNIERESATITVNRTFLKSNIQLLIWNGTDWRYFELTATKLDIFVVLFSNFLRTSMKEATALHKHMGVFDTWVSAAKCAWFMFISLLKRSQ